MSYLGTAIPYIGGAISSFGASSAVAVAGGGTASVANAYIAGGVLVGTGILCLIPMKGKPNSTIKSGGSYGEYDENGNLKYRVDTTGKPHFIKKYGKKYLPHVHKFEWYLRDGVWRFTKEVLPHL